MRESCAWHGAQQNDSSLSPLNILSACRLKLFTHDNVGSDCTLNKLLSQLCRRCCWPGKSLNIPGSEKRGQCVSVRYVAHAHARFNFCRETSPTLAAGRKEGRKPFYRRPTPPPPGWPVLSFLGGGGGGIPRAICRSICTGFSISCVLDNVLCISLSLKYCWCFLRNSG